jgi:hypothetical protein
MVFWGLWVCLQSELEVRKFKESPRLQKALQMDLQKLLLQKMEKGLGRGQEGMK